MAKSFVKSEPHKGSAVLAALDGTLKMRPGVGDRSARAIRLKNELNLMLELVVNIRERLESELKDAVSDKFINRDFVSKLKDLSQIFERLTSARIQLDKAERAMEAELTPAQEKDAVKNFVRALVGFERGEFLRDEWAYHIKHGGIAEKAPDGVFNG